MKESILLRYTVEEPLTGNDFSVGSVAFWKTKRTEFALTEYRTFFMAEGITGTYVRITSIPDFSGNITIEATLALGKTTLQQVNKDELLEL